LRGFKRKTKIKGDAKAKKNRKPQRPSLKIIENARMDISDKTHRDIFFLLVIGSNQKRLSENFKK